LKTGDKLGELVDEYPGKRITGYWSPGPKQYLLTFEDKITKEYSQILKIRGMTLNEEAENKISAEKFKMMVEKIGEEPDESDEDCGNDNLRICVNDFGVVYSRYKFFLKSY